MLEAQGEVVQVSWVGVQNATSYRIFWKRTDGEILVIFKSILTLLCIIWHFLYYLDCFANTNTILINVLMKMFFESSKLNLDHGRRSIKSVFIGGEERNQLVGGNVTSVDLRQLDQGAQYEVKVLALVQNREGPPVSVRVTTGECFFSEMFSQYL